MPAFVPEDIAVLEQTGDCATAAFIFLHGAGETGELTKQKFKKYLRAEGHPYFKFYFPTAPERYLTIRDVNERYWFDCYRVGPICEEVKCRIQDAENVTDMLEKIIEEEITPSGITRERIVIGGFSQGGMVSIYAAYVRGIRVGGVAGAAVGFPFHTQASLLSGITTPLLTVYGLRDAFITPASVDQSWQMFRAKKIPLTTKTLQYQGHSMDTEYAKTIFNWLEKHFPPL